jgi:hypothetical protein
MRVPVAMPPAIKWMTYGHLNLPPAIELMTYGHLKTELMIYQNRIDDLSKLNWRSTGYLA